jgi:hypothetical protein
MYIIPSDIYEALIKPSPLSQEMYDYIQTNVDKMLEFMRCKLMHTEVNMQAMSILYSSILADNPYPFCIPILWDSDFQKTVDILLCVPEEDLSYTLVRDYIFYKHYLFKGPRISETLHRALTLLNTNPMYFRLWCMITQAIMECAPDDKKRELCIEDLEPSCSKSEFIDHVLNIGKS